MGQSSEHQNRDAKLNKYQRNHDKYIYIYIYIYIFIYMYIYMHPFSDARINDVCAVSYVPGK